MAQKRTYDAIVIGAGIIGSSISLALARSGKSVLCVDRNPAAGYGSTSSSSAIIRTPYSTLSGCALAWEGLHIWRDWPSFLERAGQAPLVRLTEAGMLAIDDPASDMMDIACGHLSALDIPWERWSPQKIKEQFPGFSLDCYYPPRVPSDPDFGDSSGEDLPGAIWTPDAGYINDPQLAAQNLFEAAVNFGADFMFCAEVCGISQHQNRVDGIVLSTGEAIGAGVVVNAAGPYSSALNRLAGVDGDMQVQGRPLHIEVCHLPRPEAVTASEGAPFIVLDLDAGVYLRTEQQTGLYVGGTEPACDALHFLKDPDDLDRNPTDQWTAQAYRAALRVPDLCIPGQAKGVTDLYDATADWTPIYDKSSLDGFYIAAGTSGNQFKNGPVVGELMAGLIAYCEAGGDHDTVPYRFACKRSGHTVDTATFSRQRIVSSAIGNVLG